MPFPSKEKTFKKTKKGVDKGLMEWYSIKAVRKRQLRHRASKKVDKI